MVREVKAHKHVSLTNQIKDFILYAAQENKSFVLQVRKTTKVSREIAKFAAKHNVKFRLKKGLK